MKIIEPSVELWEEKNYTSHVAKCARVCYGKETGDDRKTINNLINNKHFSVFRHATFYYIIKETEFCSDFIISLNRIISNGIKVCGIDVKYKDKYYYIVCNGNFMLENPYVGNIFEPNRVTAKKFDSTEVGHQMMRYTFAITTQISTSRELNRVSPNNITEQSTRYVYEDGSIVRPHWITKKDVENYNNDKFQYINHIVTSYLTNCSSQFNVYKALINLDVKKQDARGVLPLDTATKVIYTYSIEEWKHILELRCDKRAHPNAQIIANIIRINLIHLGYNI